MMTLLAWLFGSILILFGIVLTMFGILGIVVYVIGTCLNAWADFITGGVFKDDK